ncbi:armadillo-type protein [Gamsiella multidivaricata]|uniref:armadillo-type protein n=1 Tax=Gamsiella multidivaricata TaxID=101098 RepID=UPI00221E3AA5|nr:armadillo-type protein [Gamsiella multidivaricata]KAI7831757.1 armadillo-type protein [Gamsiella multidivaricata]
MRAEAMVALRKMLQGAGRGSTDQTNKEVLKTLKVTILDKALIMRSSSAECLTALVKHASITFTRSELEASIALFFKAMDDSTYAIRKSVATLVATLLYSKFQGEENLSMASTQSPPPSTGKQAVGTEAFTLDVNELLTHLSSAYNKPNTSREVRAGLSETYAALFIMLGPSIVERHYGTILRHLLTELVSNLKNTGSRFEILTVREHVEYLLRGVIGARLLSESGQIASIRELVGSWLKSWPAVMPGDIEPSEYALISALNETSALLLDLGGAASSVQDILMSSLTNLVSHPSRAVQIATAWCLRCLCISLPTNLAKLIQTLSAKLSTDLGTLNNNGANFQDIATRSYGLSYAIGGLITVISVHPLYVSFEMSARIFSMAAQLVKNSASKEIRVAAAQIQIAWVLIGALMCLGPNFVKMHLPQLLLLWRTTLPKFTSKDASSTTRTELDWAFMVHIRECALGSIASFLLHNSDKLVTVDVSKRIAALLSNTLAFAAVVPTSFPQQPSTAGNKLQQHELLNIKPSDRDDALRKRIFECFVAMRHISAFEMYHPVLIKAALDVFSDPDRTSGTAVTNAISAATFTSVWAVDDGYGYGVTGKIQGLRCDVAARTSGRQEEILDGKDYDSATRTTETLLKKPILGAPEHEPMVVYTTYALPSSVSRYSLPKPRPIATGVIDAAIELFAILLPLQSSALQGSLMDDLSKMLKSSTLDKNPGRKMAIQVNAVVAILGATKYAMAEGKRHEQHAFEGPLASSLSQSILRDSIVHSDPYIRFVACEALGGLTSILGSLTITNQIKYLMDQVVANRDPDARAGYALALGNVFSHLGGMMAGGHLRSVVEYLTSLSRDPHPIVHKWSLHSLALTISSAGLMFSPYVSSTLTNVATVYLAESHEPAGAGSVATANIAMQSELSVYHEMGRIIYGLIGILGPELQSSAKVRELCVSLVEELRNEDDEFVIVQGIRCTQHLIMFAPLLVDMSTLVPFLQARLRRSTGLSLKKAAMTCMYQLVQRDVKSVFQHSMGGLDDQFFKLLDTDPTLQDVKDVVRSWITQTALEQPSQWIDICRKVLSRTAIDEGQESGDGMPANSASDIHQDGGGGEDAIDDDDDGEDMFDNVSKSAKKAVQPAPVAQQAAAEPLPAAAPERSVKAAPALPPRWRTRIFALECIRQVIDVVANSGIADHFDLAVARRKKKNFGADFLVLKVADLIKMTVYAASTPIQEIRMEGLLLLRQTIERFKSTADPEVPDSVLLEQYQAQIGAALTPAFTAESTPEVVSLGVKVCAVYVGSGIIQEVDRFGRVLKLLIGALEKCKEDKRLTAVGDVTDLTPHASQMIKWAVLNAWAELQVASVHRQYLVAVLKPNLEELCKLWANALEEYARSRVESEAALAGSVSTTGNTGSTGLFDANYTDSGRDTEKNFDQSSTLKILGAVSSLVDEKNEYMIQALMRITRPEAILPTEDTTKMATIKDETKNDGVSGITPTSMSGADNNVAVESASEPAVRKSKPLRLIHVIFGLCLEILAKTSSAGSSFSQSQANLNVAANDSALQGCLCALHSILNPLYINEEFLSKVFLEMMTILERVAWMEGSRVQGLVVGVISTVIWGYGKELLFVEEKEGEEGTLISTVIDPELVNSPALSASSGPEDAVESASSEELNVSVMSTLPESRLRSIVQLLVELYIQKCVGSNVKSAKTKSVGGRASQKTTPETIELLSRVTEMLAVLVKVAPPKYQLHLAAVTLNVLIGVLRDPVFQTELGPHVLVNIRSVMDSLNKNSVVLDPKFLELILNGALGALLKKQAAFAPGKAVSVTMTESDSMGFSLGDEGLTTAKGREEVEMDSDMDVSPVEITEWCNGLLGMMLILTSCTGVRIRRTFLEQFERLVMSSIESNIGKIVTVGYQCLKGVILIESASAATTSTVGAKTAEAGRMRARQFMRKLIPFVVTTIVVKAAQESATTKDDKVGMQIIEEGIQTLNSLAAASTEVARPGMVSVIMSTVVPLLQPVNASSLSSSVSSKAMAVHTLALNNLLGLGTQFPQEFRQGLGALSMERRTRLENAIRQSVLQQQEQQQRQQEREQREQERLARERDRVKIELKSSFAGFM